MNDILVGWVDCTVTDFNSAAQTMDDIAALVEEVGLEKLSKDLGFNMSIV